jgi:hypothetical protein
VTARVIVALALFATICLAVGALLLDVASPIASALALAVLALGVLLAAAAIAGAWRTPASVTRRAPDPPPARQSPRATR